MNSKILFPAIFLFGIFTGQAYPSQALVFNATDSSGEWRKGLVADREVVSTDKPSAKSEIQVYIEEPGKYELFAYIHHNWRSFVPGVNIEVLDDEGILYKGYHRIENIWYLDSGDPGRWFMVSLTQGEFWELPMGRLRIRFWADARATAWDEGTEQMEGRVSIDKFFLVPVRGAGNNPVLPWLIYPETGKGNWEVFDYQPTDATNLVESARRGQVLSIPVKVPSAGYYRLYAAVFSSSDNGLRITFRGKTDKQAAGLKIKGKDTWSLVMLDPVHLEQGEYDISLEHRGQGSISLDYLILLPVND